MNNELKIFVEKARSKDLNNEEIEQRLIAGGWNKDDVKVAIANQDDLIVPTPPSGPASPNQFDANNPVPVVQNLSTRGFEYSIMFFSLWASVLGIAGLLNSLVSKYLGGDPSSSGSLDVFWVTILVVFAPIFAVMFLRLKKAELANPLLLKDPSRRKLSHLTQFATFITGAIYLIYFVYSLMSGRIGGEYGMKMSELVMHLLVTVVLVGVVFFYYWREEHSSVAKPPQQTNASL